MDTSIALKKLSHDSNFLSPLADTKTLAMGTKRYGVLSYPRMGHGEQGQDRSA